MQEGESAENVHVIVEGWTATYRTLEDGRRQIVSVLLPGDCHIGSLAEGRARYSLGAITSCVVDVFPVSAVRRAIETDPVLRQDFWSALLASVSMQQEWTVMLGRRTAMERLGHLFCELLYRMRQIGRVVDDSCYFPLTQVDLADAVGLTPVHLNRTLQALRASQLVSLDHRRLAVLDMERLTSLSLFAPLYLDHGVPRHSMAAGARAHG